MSNTTYFWSRNKKKNYYVDTRSGLELWFWIMPMGHQGLPVMKQTIKYLYLHITWWNKNHARRSELPHLGLAMGQGVFEQIDSSKVTDQPLYPCGLFKAITDRCIPMLMLSSACWAKFQQTTCWTIFLNCTLFFFNCASTPRIAVVNPFRKWVFILHANLLYKNLFSK